MLNPCICAGPVRPRSKWDKPNICHFPNITMCSKNTHRSGSAHMWAEPEYCSSVLPACLSQSRPSVTTWEQHTLAHPSPLLSAHQAFTQIHSNCSGSALMLGHLRSRAWMCLPKFLVVKEISNLYDVWEFVFVILTVIGFIHIHFPASCHFEDFLPFKMKNSVFIIISKMIVLTLLDSWVPCYEIFFL